MARILFAWELGGGLGHLMRARPIIEELQRRGHVASAALRDRRQLLTAWPNIELTVLDAPHKSSPTADEIHPVKYYSQILHNIGWSNPNELLPLLKAWQEIYRSAKPDFVLHDHCPTGLLVSQRYQIPHALIGTGFCIPPAESAFQLLRTWTNSSPEEEQKASQIILANINAWMITNHQGTFSIPTEPYGRANERFLTTFAELDHFGMRSKASYWGIPNASSGSRPAWPKGEGPRLFAYLHNDATLAPIIELLNKLETPTLIYIGSKSRESFRGYSTERVHIAESPVDLAWAAQEASIGILNGSHGSTAAFLLAGKPVLQLPIQLEQYLGAKKSVALGAALLVDRHHPAEVIPALKRLLTEPEFQAQAMNFSLRYRSWTPARQTGLIVDRIEELLGV